VLRSRNDVPELLQIHGIEAKSPCPPVSGTSQRSPRMISRS